MDAELILDVRSVSRRVGSSVVLESVSFQLARRDPGEIVGLLGPSGIGKSQLLRILSGLDAPDSGEIHREREPSRRGGVGLVLQNSPLLPHRTTLGNLELAARLSGHSSRGARARAQELVSRLHLSRCALRYPTQLSGGERQRTAIAQQLVGGATLLLLDEPFAGLDAGGIREVVELLREVTRRGTTIVVVTHDIRLAVATADRILILDRRDGETGARIQHEHDLRALGIARASARDSTVARASLEAEIESYFEAQWQSHRRFKLFAGPLARDGVPMDLAAKIAAFAGTVAAKSIGAEYHAALGGLILTLGYRIDEEPYPIQLSCLRLGDVSEDRLESALAAHCRDIDPVICHDLFRAPDGQLVAIFMTTTAGS